MHIEVYEPNTSRGPVVVHDELTRVLQFEFEKYLLRMFLTFLRVTEILERETFEGVTKSGQ